MRKIIQKTIDGRSGKTIYLESYKQGVINTKGKKVTPLKYYELVVRFAEGETGVMKKGKWGLYNRNGKMVIPIQYEGICTFPVEKLYGVKLNEEWGFVNEKNQVIIPFQYFTIDCEGGFKDGKMNVKRSENTKGIYIDREGVKIK